MTINFDLQFFQIVSNVQCRISIDRIMKFSLQVYEINEKSAMRIPLQLMHALSHHSDRLRVYNSGHKIIQNRKYTMKKRSQTSTPLARQSKAQTKTSPAITTSPKRGDRGGRKTNKKSATTHTNTHSCARGDDEYVMLGGEFYAVVTRTDRQGIRQFVKGVRDAGDPEVSKPATVEWMGKSGDKAKFKGTKMVSEHWGGRNGKMQKQDIGKWVEDEWDGYNSKQLYHKTQKYEKTGQYEKYEKSENYFRQQKQKSQKSTDMNVQEIVKSLPLEQKLSLMKQLQRQLNPNPQQAPPETSPPLAMETIQPEPQKFTLVNLKLTSIEKQLSSKREHQIEKINKLYYEGELTASERKYKIRGVEKIKDRKARIINCTRSLFYTLLHHRFDHDGLKAEHIEEAMRELESLSQVDIGSPERDRDRKRDGHVDDISIHSDAQFERISHEEKNKSEDMTDISDKKSSQDESLLITPDHSSSKPEHVPSPSPSPPAQPSTCQTPSPCLISSPSESSVLPIARRLHIPQLASRDKQEQQEWQRRMKASQRMRIEIDRKIGFQMSEHDDAADGAHFTTLSDINGFIVELYEFVMGKDMEQVVSRLNMPYGKATKDKIFLLQQNGEVDDLEYFSVLDETHLNQFMIEMALLGKRFSEAQKIHNRAVFDSFNKHLNAYRPYYELEGDVYPWFVSEKGLTFYEINEDNIEEVFQKTKIKVLEQCSALCGIIPFGIEASQCIEVLQQKNNENFSKQEKQVLLDGYLKWGLKIMDYDTLVRMHISEEILIKEIVDFATNLLFF